MAINDFVNPDERRNTRDRGIRGRGTQSAFQRDAVSSSERTGGTTPQDRGGRSPGREKTRLQGAKQAANNLRNRIPGLRSPVSINQPAGAATGPTLSQSANAAGGGGSGTPTGRATGSPAAPSQSGRGLTRRLAGRAAFNPVTGVGAPLAVGAGLARTARQDSDERREQGRLPGITDDSAIGAGSEAILGTLRNIGETVPGVETLGSVASNLVGRLTGQRQDAIDAANAGGEVVNRPSGIRTGGGRQRTGGGRQTSLSNTGLGDDIPGNAPLDNTGLTGNQLIDSNAIPQEGTGAFRNETTGRTVGLRSQPGQQPQTQQQSNASVIDSPDSVIGALANLGTIRNTQNARAQESAAARDAFESDRDFALDQFESVTNRLNAVNSGAAGGLSEGEFLENVQTTDELVANSPELARPLNSFAINNPDSGTGKTRIASALKKLEETAGSGFIDAILPEVLGGGNRGIDEKLDTGDIASLQDLDLNRISVKGDEFGTQSVFVDGERAAQLSEMDAATSDFFQQLDQRNRQQQQQRQGLR